MKNDLLRIYLQDHDAASVAGVALVRRLARENASTAFAQELRQLALEIAHDRETLAGAMHALGVEPSGVKVALARAGERLFRLKPNRRVVSYSPLSRVLELETLAAGIQAKRGLWRALDQAVRKQLPDADLNELLARADAQLAVVERLHNHATALAFGSALGADWRQ
jgi:hypothetical protein